MKRECIRQKTPLDIEDARHLVGEFVDHYNTNRLHSAIGYITPKDKLEGREAEIFADRDRKPEENRKTKRKEAGKLLPYLACQGCKAPEGLVLDSNENILSLRGLKIPSIGV